MLPAGRGRTAARAGAAALLIVSIAAAAENPSAPANTGPGFSTAEVQSVKNGEVVVRREGKNYSFEWSALSPAEQTAARAWQPPAEGAKEGIAATDSDIEIKIAVEAGAPAAPDAAGPGQLAVKVTLQNKETLVNFKNLKGTLVLIGQEAGRSNRLVVLAVQKFSGDLAARGSFEFARPAVTEATAGTTPNQPGYPYKGYVFVLQNGEGNIIQFLHSGSFVKHGNEALKLKAGEVFAGPSPTGYAAPRPRAATPRTSDAPPLTKVRPGFGFGF
jgi:hypothetical protein